MHVIHTKSGATSLIILAGALSLLQSCLMIPVPPPRHVPAREIRVNLDVIKVKEHGGGDAGAVYEARFFDAKDKRIILDYGAVYLNGIRMEFGSTFFSDPYYELDEDKPAFRHDSLYTFRIVLDSVAGKEYFCSVRAQKGDMLSSEDTPGPGDSLLFTWRGDTTLPVRVNYILDKNHDSASSDYKRRSATFQPPHKQPLKIWMEKRDLYSYQLESVASGTVDPAFRGGSVESMVRLGR